MRVQSCIYIEGDKKEIWQALTALELKGIKVTAIKVGSQEIKQAPERGLHKLVEQYELEMKARK